MCDEFFPTQSLIKSIASVKLRGYSDVLQMKAYNHCTVMQHSKCKSIPQNMEELQANHYHFK